MPNARTLGSPRLSRMSRVMPMRSGALIVRPSVGRRASVRFHVASLPEAASDRRRTPSCETRDAQSLADASSIARIAGVTPRDAHAPRMRSSAAEAGMREVAGDAEKIREVELADPQHVDTRHRRDGVDVRETLVGLDLHDDHRAIVHCGDLCRQVPTLVVIGANPNAAPRRPRGGIAQAMIARASSAVATMGIITPNAPVSSARAMNAYSAPWARGRAERR